MKLLQYFGFFLIFSHTFPAWAEVPEVVNSSINSDEIWYFETDLDQNGVGEIWISGENFVNGKMGNLWIPFEVYADHYVRIGGKYGVVPTFRKP